MIEQYLLNTNEIATIRKILTFHDLNKVQVWKLMKPRDQRGESETAS
jgi:hypothetical protein